MAGAFSVGRKTNEENQQQISELTEKLHSKVSQSLWLSAVFERVVCVSCVVLMFNFKGILKQMYSHVCTHTHTCVHTHTSRADHYLAVSLLTCLSVSLLTCLSVSLLTCLSSMWWFMILQDFICLNIDCIADWLWLISTKSLWFQLFDGRHQKLLL